MALDLLVCAQKHALPRPFAMPKNWLAQEGATSPKPERFFVGCQNIVIYTKLKIFTIQYKYVHDNK